MAEKKTTLKDIARATGLAPNTISAILNNREYVWASTETRQRVLDTAKKLNYKPNKWAQGIRLKESKTVACVIPDLMNPHYTKMARLLEEGLQQFGYDLIIEESKLSLNMEKKIIAKLCDANIDGVFCSTLTSECDDLFQQITNEGRPCIFIGSGREKIGDTLYTDYTAGLQTAMRHLAQLGHKKIGYVLGLPEGDSPELRKNMFCSALKDAGLTPYPDCVLVCEPSIASAREQVTSFLLQWPEEKRPTALLATNDLLAIGTMRGAMEAGFQVPKHLSVVGTDNLEISRNLPVSLTSISYPAEQVIQKAIELFIERKKTKSYTNPRRYDFPTTLIIGESTGPVKSNLNSTSASG
jgi:LacI family transcriptional regulator